MNSFTQKYEMRFEDMFILKSNIDLNGNWAQNICSVTRVQCQQIILNYSDMQ